jgi:hypothetical protein
MTHFTAATEVVLLLELGGNEVEMRWKQYSVFEIR